MGNCMKMVPRLTVFSSNSSENVTDRNAQIVTKSGIIKTWDLKLQVVIKSGWMGNGDCAVQKPGAVLRTPGSHSGARTSVSGVASSNAHPKHHKKKAQPGCSNHQWEVNGFHHTTSAIRVINGCMLPSWKRKYYLISFMSVRTWLNKQPKSYLRCYTKPGHNLYYTITTIRNHNHKQHSLITTSVFEYEYLFESN